jgi:hypothetical protein
MRSHDGLHRLILADDAPREELAHPGELHTRPRVEDGLRQAGELRQRRDDAGLGERALVHAGGPGDGALEQVQGGARQLAGAEIVARELHRGGDGLLCDVGADGCVDACGDQARQLPRLGLVHRLQRDDLDQGPQGRPRLEQPRGGGLGALADDDDRPGPDCGFLAGPVVTERCSQRSEKRLSSHGGGRAGRQADQSAASCGPAQGELALALGRVVHGGDLEPERAKPRSARRGPEFADIAPAGVRLCKVVALLLG